MTTKKKIDQSKTQYRYCVAYEVEGDPIKRKGKWYKTVNCLRVDLNKPNKVAEAVYAFQVSAKTGEFLTRHGGLLPIRHTYEEALEKVKAMAAKLERRAERKRMANRGFVKQNDDKMKITVLCRHKGEDKYGYLYKKLDPEDAAKRKKILTLGRAKYAASILDKHGVPHPNLDKIIGQ